MHYEMQLPYIALLSDIVVFFSFPILDGVSQKRDATILTNGSLFLPNVVTNDADTTYSCRVYNNIGADTHTYKLIVQGQSLQSRIRYMTV